MIAFVSPKTSYFLLLPLLGMLLASCNTTKYLQEDEVFLVKTEIDLSKELKIKKKGNLKYQLSTLYKQKPNENFLFVPKEWFYYRLQDTLDKSQFIKRYRRWQMRQFGEEPTLHDQELTDATAQAMEYYLQHQGYFQADVEANFSLTNEVGTKGLVTYYVTPRQQYLIDTVAYFSKDTAINRKLQFISKNSILQAGEPMSEELYSLEVRRITDYFRNDGYAYFQSNHVAGLQGDSLDGKISLQVEVLRPHNDSIHRQYYIGDIFIQPKYDPNNPVATQIDTIREGIYILSKGGDYGIKTKTLLSDLYLENGDLFRQSNYDKTKRQLGALGVFRIITLREEPDPDDPTKINYRLFLTPNKRYEYGLDLEINTSNSPLIDQRLLGVAGSISNRHRNLFKGAELLIANVEGGVDLNLRNLDSIVNTLDFRIQTDLYYPKFVDYFSIWKMLNKIGITNDAFLTAQQEKASTKVTLAYNYLERINFYTINSFNASFGYDLQRSPRLRYIFNHVGIEYLSPRTTDYFEDEFLSESEFLRRSFDKQFFTSFFFRDLSFSYSSLPNRFGESFSFITRVELSGAEVAATNALINSFREVADRRSFALRFPNDTISFSEFFLLELDLRHYRRINDKNSLAFRAYVGLASPFGYSNSVPYVKQFFVGGPNSIRAWIAREIGPGGYRDVDPDIPDGSTTFFYQTGDFKLELNAEYRFEFLTFLGIKYEGAIFLDIGNVYTLQKDTTRRFSQLLWNPRYERNDKGFFVKTGDNFIKYLAIGTGLGLRLDFSYFVFRFDVGLPLRNPYPTPFPTSFNDEDPEEERFWRQYDSFPWGDLNYNIGLGYPF